MLPELKLTATDLEGRCDRIRALLDAIAEAGNRDDPCAVIKSVAWSQTISNLLRTSVEEMLKLDADQRAQVAAAFRHDGRRHDHVRRTAAKSMRSRDR